MARRTADGEYLLETSADAADAVLRSLIAAGPVADVTVEEPSMESILERIYTSHGGDAKCASTAPSREST